VPLSNTAIANRAIRHAGVSKTIGALTDASAEARAVVAFYDEVVDEVLRDFDWPFARRFVSLAVVQTNPTTEWAYSYRAPADLLAVRRLLNGLTVRTDTEATRIPFLLGADDSGGLIYTDLAITTNAPVYLRYTKRITDVTKFPPDFARSVELLLGAYIAPSLTEGDELKLRERNYALYRARVSTAQANAANEEQRDIPADSEFVTVRD
jgi:hypothetical protein